ncbi:MAG: phosphorylase, partial [Flavobacterium sp.]
MIKSSELILNPDGSIYHLNLRPEHIASDIIFVGDQNRVEKITQFFDSIEFSTQKREFKTQTGRYKGKRITVMSTGIGPDNIDIVINELDALVNIDFTTREIKDELTSLNIIRIGTSGSLQEDIPVDSFVMSKY